MEFEDHERLGVGGFGEVYRCQRTGDGTFFAKKLLTQAQADIVARFQREVRILAKLSHPRIVKVEFAHVDESPYWYTMPLYATSLSREIPSIVGDRKSIVQIFLCVLEAMQYAHAQGVLHRDLTPRNILMNGVDDVVVSDIGLSRDLYDEVTRATFTGDYMGSAGFVAPEQARDAKRADQRSDVFSLGRVLLNMYTGVHPDAGPSDSALPTDAGPMDAADPLAALLAELDVKELADAGTP